MNQVIERIDAILSMYFRYREDVCYTIIAAALIGILLINVIGGWKYKKRYFREWNTYIAIIRYIIEPHFFAMLGIFLLNHKIRLFELEGRSLLIKRLFVVLMLITLVYSLYMIAKYYKTYRNVLSNIFVLLQLSVYISIFATANETGRYHIEYVVACFALCFIYFLKRLMIGSIKRKNACTNIRLDRPTEKLYRSRERQLQSFIPILELQKEEPYALMVSAPWGIGKTSFMKRLEQEVEDEFIWIGCGSERSDSDVLNEIADKICDILTQNHIMVGKHKLIRDYFQSFANAIDKTGAYTNLVQNVLDDDDFAHKYSKDYLNEKLSYLDHSIYIVIDDLDRCNDNYRNKMFLVIMESTNLMNCKPILLVDGHKWNEEKKDFAYIEKYINYKLYLCDIKYEEIIENYYPEYFSESFYKEIQTDRLKGHISEKKVKEVPYDVLERLQYRIAEQEEGTDADELSMLTDLQEAITNDLRNTRKVKNYLKEITRDILILDRNFGKRDTQYKNENFIDVIIEKCFYQFFLPEHYELAKNYSSINEYLTANPNEYALYNAVFVDSRSVVSNGIKSLIMDTVFYRLYVFDENNDSDKTTYDVILDLTNDLSENASITEYNVRILECMDLLLLNDENSISCLRQIIVFLNETPWNDKNKKIVVLLAQKFANTTYLYNSDTDKLLTGLQRIISNHMKTSKEFESLNIPGIIRGLWNLLYQELLKNLYVMYGFTYIQERTGNVISCESECELCTILETIVPATQESAKQYIEQLEEDLKSTEEEEIRLEIIKNFSNINKISHIIRTYERLDCMGTSPIDYDTINKYSNNMAELFCDENQLYEIVKHYSEAMEYDAFSDYRQLLIDFIVQLENGQHVNCLELELIDVLKKAEAHFLSEHKELCKGYESSLSHIKIYNYLIIKILKNQYDRRATLAEEFEEELELDWEDYYASDYEDILRETCGLPSLSVFDVILNDEWESNDFHRTILDGFENLSNCYEEIAAYCDQYHELCSVLETLIDDETISNDIISADILSLYHSYHRNAHRPTMLTLNDLQDWILELMDETDFSEIPYDSVDYIEFGSENRFVDSHKSAYKLIMNEADLSPENGYQEELQCCIKDEAHEELSRGWIEIDYGYAESDENEGTGNSRAESIHFDLYDISNFITQIATSMDMFVDTHNAIMRELERMIEEDYNITL